MAAMLAAEGARLVVADVEEARCRSLAAELGATVVEPSEILSADLDVLAPCAAGAVVTAEVAQALTARYVIGAANNVLAEPGVAATLRARGIVYVPDFIANAGGLIACVAEVYNDRIGHFSMMVIDLINGTPHFALKPYEQDPLRRVIPRNL
jgi:leucine dehydrogenase